MKYVKCFLCVMAALFVFISRTEMHQRKGRSSQLKNEATWDNGQHQQSIWHNFFKVSLLCHISYINWERSEIPHQQHLSGVTRKTSCFLKTIPYRGGNQQTSEKKIFKKLIEVSLPPVWFAHGQTTLFLMEVKMPIHFWPIPELLSYLWCQLWLWAFSLIQGLALIFYSSSVLAYLGIFHHLIIALKYSFSFLHEPILVSFTARVKNSRVWTTIYLFIWPDHFPQMGKVLHR